MEIEPLFLPQTYPWDYQYSIFPETEKTPIIRWEISDWKNYQLWRKKEEGFLAKEGRHLGWGVVRNENVKGSEGPWESPLETISVGCQKFGLQEPKYTNVWTEADWRGIRRRPTDKQTERQQLSRSNPQHTSGRPVTQEGEDKCRITFLTLDLANLRRLGW